MSPVGLGTKNHCAGEGQQQFTGLDCIPLSLIGDGSVNTFPRKGGIVGGVVFYAVRVVSKKSRQLVLTRTYYLILTYHLRPDRPSDFIPLSSPTKILNICLISPIRATCSAYTIPLDLINLIILAQIINTLMAPASATLSLLGANILISARLCSTIYNIHATCFAYITPFELINLIILVQIMNIPMAPALVAFSLSLTYFSLRMRDKVPQP
jgi:hypothetical protein